MWIVRCYITLGLFMCIHCLDHEYTSSDAARLHSDLLTNYSAKVRPSAQTIVSLEFGLMHITELNIVRQTLHCVGFLMCIWGDDRLTWNRTEYGNMSDVFIPLSDIWAPPMVLNNAADQIKIINDDNDLSSLNAVVFDSGYVIWLAPSNFIAHCSINIKYYPFDSQQCDFVVSSWMFLEEHVHVIASDQEINLDIYKDHGEWDITGTSVTNVTRILSGHKMPAVQFTVHLVRKYSYYLLNMLLPVIILAMMGPFVFMLPPASGEKISYALTILLSLSVVMTLVSDNIPPTSTHTCLLSVYLLMTFMICSLETLLTVWTCRNHDLCGKHYKMNSSMMKFTRFLATVTGYRRHVDLKDSTGGNGLHNIHTSEEQSEDKENKNNKNMVENFQGVTQYSPEELTFLFDRFNFAVFMTLTVTVTVVTIIVLQVGGQP